MEHVITFVAWRRPEYTRQVIDALRRCEGIEKYTVLSFVEPGSEPGCDETWEMIKAMDFADCYCSRNTRRLGTAKNTYQALHAGFDLADYVIHLENDCVLAPDALRYFEHCRDTYRCEPEVFSVTAFNRCASLPASSAMHELKRRKWFHCHGWATWRDRWCEPDGMKHKWAMTGPRVWDVHVIVQLLRGRHEVYPILPRVKYIGVHGIHERDEAWHMENRHTCYHAGNVGRLPPGQFYETAEQINCQDSEARNAVEAARR